MSIRVAGRPRVLVLAAVTLAATVLLPSSSAQASSDAPVSLNSEARCDTALGQWQATYTLSNNSPATVTILSAVDAATQQPVPLTRYAFEPGASDYISVRSLPVGTPSVELTVVVKRSDRMTPVKLSAKHLLPSGCVPVPATTDCVLVPNARYRHVFDGAAGTLTVELVGKPLCAGQVQDFHLDAGQEAEFAYSTYYMAMTSLTSKLSMRVNLPPCSVLVRAYASNPNGSGGPYEPHLLGSPTAGPGHQSAGPLATYTTKGGSCRTYATAGVVIHCDGTVRVFLSNGAAAAKPASIQVGEGYSVPGYPYPFGSAYRVVSLEPGESTILAFRPRSLEQYGGFVEIYLQRHFEKTPYVIPPQCASLPTALRRHTTSGVPAAPRRAGTTLPPVSGFTRP